MEGIFWPLFTLLVILSAILAFAAVAAVVGAVLIIRSRGNYGRRSEKRIGTALVLIGALPFLCVCLNALASHLTVLSRP
jgi:hypothetical protein